MIGSLLQSANTSAPPKKQANYYQNKLMFEHSLIGAITFLNESKGEQSWTLAL